MQPEGLEGTFTVGSLPAAHVGAVASTSCSMSSWSGAMWYVFVYTQDRSTGEP